MAFIDLKLILKTILLLVMLRYAALYALIIVVMLILAGVSVNIMLGDNGLIIKAQAVDNRTRDKICLSSIKKCASIGSF